MANTISALEAQIAGGHISSIGGAIRIARPGYSTKTIDVGRWTLHQNFEQKPLVCSGLLGATDSRLCGYGYTFMIEALYDARTPPEVWLRSRSGVELYLYFGDKELSNIPGSTQTNLYWVPEAVIDTVDTVLDASGKRMMRQIIKGHTRGHAFLLPDWGTRDDQGTTPGAYAKYIGVT